MERIASWRAKHIRADFNFAFPSAEIAVMGPDGGCQHFVQEGAVTGLGPEGFQRPEGEGVQETLANPFAAARKGFIDAVIQPAQTRPRLIRALNMLANKRQVNPPKKHGNIPL